MTSRFSFSTTNSSPTNSTFDSSPAFSPPLPTPPTFSSNAHHTAPTAHHDKRRTPRWQPLSQDGLPRSSSSSMTRSHRFHSPGTTPVMSPSPSPRRFTPPATTSAAAACPAQPAPPTQPCSASPSPEPCSNSRDNNNNNTPRGALGIEEAGSSNKKRNKTTLGRVGRSMGKGLRQCSGFFKRRPDAPDEVEQVPRPAHWSEL